MNPAEIRGMGVSSALPSMVMVDANNQPIHRAYNLMDRRATREVDWLKEEVGEERLIQLTATAWRITHPSSTCCGKRTTGPIPSSGSTKRSPSTALSRFKLTGKYVVNYTAAPFYGVAYDIMGRRFDEGSWRR